MNRPALEATLTLMGWHPVFDGKALKLVHQNGYYFYAVTTMTRPGGPTYAFRGTLGPEWGRRLLAHYRCRWQRFTTAELQAIWRQIEADNHDA